MGRVCLKKKRKTPSTNWNRKCFVCKTTSRIWIRQNSKMLVKKQIWFWRTITIILSERLSRTCKSNKRYCECPATYSNHFFKYPCRNTYVFLSSYCLGYCIKFKFKCKEKFLWTTFKAKRQSVNERHLIIDIRTKYLKKIIFFSWRCNYSISCTWNFIKIK